MPSSNGLFGRLVLLLAMCAAGGFTLVPHFSDISSTADLLTQFLLQATAATAAATLVALLLRRWMVAVALALCVIAQTSFIAPTWPPKQAVAGMPSVRLVFANLWADNIRRAGAVETLRRFDADVLVLAEVLDGWEEDLEPLADLYPHRADCFQLSGCDVIVLSRLPVVGTLTSQDRWHRSRLVVAELESSLGRFSLLATHMARPLPVGQVHHQGEHAAMIAEVAGSRSGPTILVGDFNAVPWGRVVRRIEEGTDLRADRSIDGTWPSAFPWPFRLPIDHVLSNPYMRILSRDIADIPGSDHKALVIELRPERS